MKISREGGLLRVSFDAPERKNTLTTEDCAGLVAAVQDDSAHVVLIESKGSFFCGGLEAGAEPGALFDVETWRGVPVVAAIQGPAVDEGLALMACAHVVVAAQGTSFALTGMRKGWFPGLNCAVLGRAIGERRALELALTSRVFTVADAVAWGLVQHVAPAFEFDDRAEAIAAGIASNRVWLHDALS